MDSGEAWSGGKASRWLSLKLENIHLSETSWPNLLTFAPPSQNLGDSPALSVCMCVLCVCVHVLCVCVCMCCVSVGVWVCVGVCLPHSLQ